MYPNYKYFVDEKNRKVIAVSTFAGKNVKGVAKASPEDTFDLEVGKKLAKLRCDNKIALKRVSNARRKMLEASDWVSFADNYYGKMSDYYLDAVNEAYEVSNNLSEFLKTI